MRMRADVDAAAWRKLRGSDVIQKNEGAHHLPTAGGQHAAHFESTQIARARLDHTFNC
jgi:hypothetical protein